MSSSASSSPGAITLDELIALNDEIAALVRAGVPLQSGLAALGGDMPGRLGRFATAIARRTAEGEPLDAVLMEYSAELPPVYLAVVRAGLRSGRLSAALESLAGSTRRLAETRRGVVAAFLYPLVVLMLTWGFFAFFAAKIAPSLTMGLDRLAVPGHGMLAWLAGWGPSAVYWGTAVPLVLAVAAGIWWYLATRATIAEPRYATMLFGWLPWLGSTLRWSLAATFVEVLAVLLESRVPLHEAIVLAAEASGSGALIPAAKRLAEQLERGEPIAGDAASAGKEFPPLLAWLMAAGARHGALLSALKHAAETYRRRAEHQAELVRVFLPMLLMIAVGGTVVLLYALTLFVPYVGMLKALT